MHENPCDNIYLTFRFYLIGCVIDVPGRHSDPERRNSCGPLGGSAPSDRLARGDFGPVMIQASKAVSIQSQVDKFMAADFSNLVSSDDLYELDVLLMHRITVKFWVRCVWSVTAPELSARLLFNFTPILDFFCVCVVCCGILKNVFWLWFVSVKWYV